MGGILSGLIGGLVKGTTGGLAAEGERKRREEDYQKNLLTQMHVRALEDWENLSPQAQEGHIKGLETIWPESAKSGIFRGGVNLVHAIAPHLNMATLQPQAEVKPVDPLEGIATQAGLGGPETRTPAQTKILQAALYKQNLDESERKRKMAAIAGIPDLTPEERKRVEAQVETGVVLPQPVTGTWSTSPVHYTDKAGGRHEIIQNNRTRTFLDRTTGQELPTIPPDWEQTAKPIDRAPYASVGPNNELQFTDVNAVNRAFKQPGAPGSVGAGVQVRQGVPTFTPLTDTSGNVVGRWSNRAGTAQPIAPPPGAEALRRGPMGSPELDKRTSIKTMSDLLDLVEKQAKANPKYLGAGGYLTRAKRYVGREKDPIANDIYGGMADVKEALIRAKEGAVIPEAMYQRLSNMLPTPEHAPEKFWSDMKRFRIALNNLLETRSMSEAPGAAPAVKGPKGATSKTGNKILSITLSPNQ